MEGKPPKPPTTRFLRERPFSLPNPLAKRKGLVGESKAAHPPDAVRAPVEVGDGLVVVERREPAELVVLDADVVERVGDLVG